MWIYNYVTEITFSIGRAVKAGINAALYIPRTIRDTVVRIANIWIGIAVFVIIFVLWKKYKK